MAVSRSSDSRSTVEHSNTVGHWPKVYITGPGGMLSG